MKDLEELGFRAWEEGSDLLLIPIYCVMAFEENEIVVDIDTRTTRISEIDLDVRYGLVAYGFKHPELKINKEE